MESHPGQEIVLSDQNGRLKGREMYVCPSCSFYSLKHESLLVHAGRNPSHFTALSGCVDLEEARKLAEAQSTSLRERKVSPAACGNGSAVHQPAET